MQIDNVTQTTFSMAARPALADVSAVRAEERLIGRDLSIEGLMLPAPMLSRVEEAAALNILDELAAMPADWDGYGALAIDDGTLANSKRAVARLVRYAPGPEIAPNPNGTISFEWTSSAGTAHLEIGKTRFSFFVKPAGGVALAYEGAAHDVPSELGIIIAACVFPPVRSVTTITKLVYSAGHERYAA